VHEDDQISTRSLEQTKMSYKPAGSYIICAACGFLALLATIGLLELLCPGLVPRRVSGKLSETLNVPYINLPNLSALTDYTAQVYLEWRFPIHARDGQRKFTSCPFQWPNGQGDTGKFLDGIENSALWEKKHGTVYRIWSGMNPEVYVIHLV
jgi:hypothetical protein